MVKPSYLPAGAKRIWDELVPHVQRPHPSYSRFFAILCMDLWDIETLDRQLMTEKLIVKGTKGTRKHPAAQIRREKVGEVIRLAEQFGLTVLAAMKVYQAENPNKHIAGEGISLLNGQWKRDISCGTTTTH